jgi:threonine synthase
MGSADNLKTYSRSVEMLDGAVGCQQEIASEIDQQLKIAADSNLPLDRRFEAYEDIIDSEVGDTSMVRARNVERSIGLRQLYLKFEGGNPTGTQKDRIAFAQALDALRRGFDAITVATCGNYGVAMAIAAKLAGLHCHVFIPEGYRTKRIAEMNAQDARIQRVAGDYEAAVAFSCRYANAHDCYDANPGGDNTMLQLQSYGGIAYEIYDELRDAPAVVAVPVSNGTTLAGIYKGFLSLYRRGKTSRMPRMVAGSSYGKNPIVRSYLKGLQHCTDLSPEKIRENSVNEPLVNWHSIDGDLALEAVRITKGWAADATDRSMRHLSRIIRKNEGLQVLPASMAGLSALIDHHRKSALPGDRYVAILTGRGG